MVRPPSLSSYSELLTVEMMMKRYGIRSTYLFPHRCECEVRMGTIRFELSKMSEMRTKYGRKLNNTAKLSSYLPWTENLFQVIRFNCCWQFEMSMQVASGKTLLRKHFIAHNIYICIVQTAHLVDVAFLFSQFNFFFFTRVQTDSLVFVSQVFSSWNSNNMFECNNFRIESTWWLFVPKRWNSERCNSWLSSKVGIHKVEGEQLCINNESSSFWGKLIPIDVFIQRFPQKKKKKTIHNSAVEFVIDTNFICSTTLTSVWLISCKIKLEFDTSLYRQILYTFGCKIMRHLQYFRTKSHFKTFSLSVRRNIVRAKIMWCPQYLCYAILRSAPWRQEMNSTFG